MGEMGGIGLMGGMGTALNGGSKLLTKLINTSSFFTLHSSFFILHFSFFILHFLIIFLSNSHATATAVTM